MIADVLRRFCKPSKWQWTHLPMGEKRDKATAGLLQRMGVNRGWPDFIFVAWTGHIYFLELKREEDGVLLPEQSGFRALMLQWGIECEVARSFEEAIAILGRWGVVPVSLEFK
jgi:hypothetical protein